jgi:hypothetical protein
MKLVLTTAALLVMTAFTGCASRYADVPMPTRFDNSGQQKLQAAEHWRVIASHAAAQLAVDLKDKYGDRAVHVPMPEGEQVFVGGFRELLITELVAQGIPVSTKPAKAMLVDVRYSIFKFRPDRLENTRYYGDATMLAAGIWAVGGVLDASIAAAPGVDAGAKMLLTVAGLEGFSWLKNEGMGRDRRAAGPVPRSEILLTTTVQDADRIVSRKSNIYYVADEDPGLYVDRPAAHTLTVRGDCNGGRKLCAE